MDKFKDVFAAHPKADKIYVVGDMPFLKEGEANNYARNNAGEVETIERGSERSTKEKPAAKASAPKATAPKKLAPKATAKGAAEPPAE